MQFLDEISRDEIIFDWFRSESFKIPGGLPDRELIETFDSSNGEQNRVRERMLRTNFREAILKDLPRDALARTVLIEEADLPKLYVISSPEWHPNTGGTFELTAITGNLKPGRRMRIPGYLTGPIGTFETVQEKNQYLRDYDAIDTDELLVLVSAAEDGPYTIIDGNHRAAALYLSHLEDSTMPWKGALITDPRIAYYRWFVQSPASQEVKRQLDDHASTWFSIPD
jgi:hypothetical protein